MALSIDKKLEIMEQALREGYDGYMTDLWAQADPSESIDVPESPAIQEPHGAPSLPPGMLPPSKAEPVNLDTTVQPGFQSLVQSYESAAPDEQPKGEPVQYTLDDPEFYRAGGYKLKNSIDLKLDFKNISPNAYIDNYTKDYKYKKLGGMVDVESNFTEFPEEHQPLDFAKYYYNSPKHQERMIDSGYDQDQIDERSAFLDQDGPTINHVLDKAIKNRIKDQGLEPGSVASPTENTIWLDKQADAEQGFNTKEVLPHELAHLSTKFEGLNKTDTKEIIDRHKVIKDGGSFTDKEHEKTWALEQKADLDAIRYMLYEAGVYDAGVEDFDIYDMREAYELLKDSKIFQRMLESYSEDDFMWLMNNVAMGDPTEDMFEDMTYARKGGFSKTGYKENSPHKNRSFNIIKGSKTGTHITMKGVKGPLLAFDNLGNKGILKPGKEYAFAGSRVIETPLRKKKRKGGKRDGSKTKLPKLNLPSIFPHPKDGTIVVRRANPFKKRKKK